MKTTSDPVKNPSHYTHPTGIECKEITYDLPTWLGSAIKYIWRADYKGKPIEDRQKALECLSDMTPGRTQEAYTVVMRKVPFSYSEKAQKIAKHEGKNLREDLNHQRSLYWVIAAVLSTSQASLTKYLETAKRALQQEIQRLESQQAEKETWGGGNKWKSGQSSYKLRFSSTLWFSVTCF